MRRLISAIVRLMSAALAVPSCSGPPAAPAAIPSHTAAARRVLAIFEDRHLRGRPLDDGLLDALSARLAETIGCDAGAMRVRAARAQLAGMLREGDFAFAREAAQACDPTRGVDAEGLTWDALAKAYDPHSAYLTPADQRAFRAELDGAAAAERVRGRVVQYQGERIALVELPSFYLRTDGASASADLRWVIARLAAEEASVLLLDLRGNGGGVIEEALRMSAELLGPGSVGYAVGRDRAPAALRAEGSRSWTGPLVVRVDAGTASVSELVAAAIQDRGRGLIVGERTQGKGTAQTLVYLSSPLGAAAGAVRVTDRAFYRLDGRSLQLHGVEPDVVSIGGAARETERDRRTALRVGDIAPPEPGLPTPRSAAARSRLPASIENTDEAFNAMALEYAREAN